MRPKQKKDRYCYENAISIEKPRPYLQPYRALKLCFEDTAPLPIYSALNHSCFLDSLRTKLTPK